jgi:prepilin-type N-terminal cleavage/methylation domain-containing protein
MKNKKNQRQKGFTLIETIITMSLFLVILSGVYLMIQHYGDVSKTEHSRITMQQESRYMVSVFADEIKEAGAVLTLAHTSNFLAPGTPFFNGLYPLNSTYSPDGVILATGDPEAVTRLAAEFAEGDTVLNVEDASVKAYDASFPYENPQWAAGQKGIVIGTTGYLVFEVASVDIGANTITIRETPVYYSGLLSTGSYYDDAQGNSAGNTITYPGTPLFDTACAPVIRLTNFSIYVFRDIEHSKLTNAYGSPQIIRQLIRITDTHGESDPLADGSDAEYSVISENIWDLQISYIAYTDFTTANRHTAIDPTHHYFAGGSTSSDAAALLTDIRGKFLKQMDVTILAVADELGGQGEGSTAGNIPPIADNSSNYLPDRKMSYRLFSFSVEPKNFSIFY